MPRFRIKAAAINDLKCIAKFTEKTWGQAQRNKYLADFDQAFHQLADNNELGKVCDYLQTGYSAFPIGSHVIFYKISGRQCIDIIRVLHKRMDVSSRFFKG